MDINKNINKISELIERNDNKLENVNKNKNNEKKELSHRKLKIQLK